MQTTGYLIKADAPFNGYTQSILYQDAEGVERVLHSGDFETKSNGRVIREATPDLTIAEYEADRRQTFKRINLDELEALHKQYTASLITKPEPITEERYYDWLNCLPPCRWHGAGGFSVFHIMERITDDIVQWCARDSEGNCFGWQDYATISSLDIAIKLGKATTQ